MKVNLSSHDHEVAFQDLYPGFLKRPCLQQSVKMATRGDPLKGRGKAQRQNQKLTFNGNLRPEGKTFIT